MKPRDERNAPARNEPAKEPKRSRIHAVDAFVDVDVVAPFQERMDALARERPALVEHIANMRKGQG